MPDFEFRQQFDGSQPEIAEQEKTAVRELFNDTVGDAFLAHADNVITLDEQDDPATRHLTANRLSLQVLDDDGQVVNITVTNYPLHPRPHAYVDLAFANGTSSRYEQGLKSDDVIRTDKREVSDADIRKGLGVSALEDLEEPLDPTDEPDIEAIKQRAVEESLESHMGLNGQPISLSEMQNVADIVAVAFPRPLS